MPKTPFRTPNDPLIVTPGDLIRGEDATVGTAVLVRGGNSTGGNNVGGSLTLQGGDGFGTGTGGATTLSAGSPGASGAGGGVSIIASSSLAASGVGGAISVTAGDSTGVANAGNITLTPGIAGGSGADGIVIIGNSTGLQFTETTTVPGPTIAATQGRFWVRDDSPNVPVFTDDAGIDWVLNSTGSTTPVETGTPLNNLVAYVDIGDPNSYPGTGTTVTDFQGNLTGGTISGNTTYGTGALDFEGTTGALTFTKGAAVDDIFSGGGTIIVFFRARSDGEASAGELYNTGFPTGGYNLFTENQLNGDGGSVRLTFQRDFDGNNGIWDFLGVDDINVRVARLDSWNSFAIVYDDSSTANVPRPYLNGKILPDAQIQVTQTPTGTAVTDAGSSFIVGNRGADDRTYDGDFDVLLMFDTALTAEEIGAAHTVFAQRHGSHTGTGAVTRKGSDLFLYAGDYAGTGALGGGAVFIYGGTTWSDNNSSFGGRVEIRGGDSQNTLAGTGGGGPLGAVIAVGGYGDQESTHTVGDLANIGSEFGGGTLTAGNGASRTLVRGSDNDGSASGGDLIVRGGDALSTGTGNAAGGDLALTSGRGRNIQGGNILIRTRGTSGTGSQTGNIYITTQQSNDPYAIFGAQGGSGTDTGNITITTGPVGSTANTSGDITLSIGDTNAVTGNDTGVFNIIGGDMLRSGQSFIGGSPINITAGNSNGAGTSPGGSVTLTGGNQTDSGTAGPSPGGSVVLVGGNSAKNSGTGNGGDVTATGGNSTSTGGNGARGGGFIVTGGTAAGTHATDATGGPITMTAGDQVGASASSYGGAVTISAGNATGATASGHGGTITLNAGDATGGSSTGDGGDIVLNPGSASGSGAAGEVTINGKLTVTGLIDPTGLVLDEQATVPFSTTAGMGTLWVRNDTPNVLVFTDDAGTDFDLNGGGGVANLQEAYEGGNTITTDSTNGGFDVSGTQAISLDASLASNFTVDNASLTLGTTTGGSVIVSSAGAIDIDGGMTTIDSGSSISLDALAASNFTVTNDNLTLSTATSGNLIVSSAGSLDVDASAITIDGTTLSIDSTATTNLTMSANAASIGLDLTISATNIGTDGAANIVVDAQSNLDLDAGGDITLDSQVVSIDTTGASNFTVTGDDLTLSTATSGTVFVTSAGALDLDSGTASAVTVNSGAGSSSAGGAVSVTSGAGNGAFDGGAVNITAGDSGGGATGNGGTITITAGDAASTNGNGGDIVLNPGSLSGTGTDGEVTVNGKLTVTGLIDPTGLVLTEQGTDPYTTTAGDGTLWVRNDTNQTLIFTDDQGTEFEVAGGNVRRMQEITLTVQNVDRDSTNALASGLPNGGVAGVHGQNINSRIQYIEMGDSTEDDIGASWSFTLPDSYSGNGLTVEFWITGDGSASAAADMSVAVDRQETGRDLNTGGLWGSYVAATGTTISATAWITVMATATLSNSQIDSMVAGESGRIAIMRLQNDTYNGVVRMTMARVYETP